MLLGHSWGPTREEWPLCSQNKAELLSLCPVLGSVALLTPGSSPKAVPRRDAWSPAWCPWWQGEGDALREKGKLRALHIQQKREKTGVEKLPCPIS